MSPQRLKTKNKTPRDPYGEALCVAMAALKEFSQARLKGQDPYPWGAGKDFTHCVITAAALIDDWALSWGTKKRRKHGVWGSMK